MSFSSIIEVQSAVFETMGDSKKAGHRLQMLRARAKKLQGDGGHEDAPTVKVTWKNFAVCFALVSKKGSHILNTTFHAFFLFAQVRLCLGFYARGGFNGWSRKEHDVEPQAVEITDTGKWRLRQGKKLDVVVDSMFPKPMRFREVWKKV